MGLIWRPGFQFDVDASNYIEAVEAADEIASPGIGALETGVRYAINNFVIGCKQDGIWSAIKASCILAGARTLAGALAPLVGAAPTNINFVAGDYNRETGLKGNGSSKYLNSNRNNNADPQNNQHLAVFPTTVNSIGQRAYIGAGLVDIGSTYIGSRDTTAFGRNRSQTENSNLVLGSGNALIAFSRSLSTLYEYRRNKGTQIVSQSSQTPLNRDIKVYQADGVGVSDARLSFYSIGESLDLAALDGRVTDLMTAIGVAIP